MRFAFQALNVLACGAIALTSYAALAEAPPDGSTATTRSMESVPVLRPDAGVEHSTRLILLGTGGGPETRMFRSEPASLLVVDGRPYLIDCGDGVIRQLRWKGYEPEQVRTVFITHGHLDHTGGLGPFIADSWILGDINRGGIDINTAPAVQIYGPTGTKAPMGGQIPPPVGTSKSPT